MDFEERERAEIERRILARTIKIEGGCWECSYSLSKGYPRICIAGKDYKISRIIYQLYYGEIPDGMLCCHTCDNPKCICPDHLWLGTNDENMADMVKKGRAATGEQNASRKYIERRPRGEKHSCAKLTELDVRCIRLWYSAGYTQTNIAKEFKIDQVNVSLIVLRKSWKHIL